MAYWRSALWLASPPGVEFYVNGYYYELMNTSTLLQPGHLVRQMSEAARAKFSTDAGWAEASGLPKETLSRIRSSASCDLRTLGALAKAAGYTLVAVPESMHGDERATGKFGRDHEDRLLDLAASGNVDPHVWRGHGPGFLMGGLAVTLASSRGFERERYLRLAETLHPGVSTPDVFAMWLKTSQVRPSRFLPMVRKRKRLA